MGKWIEYTGSKEQIEEINASESFLLKRKDGEISFILQPPFEPNEMDSETTAEYLICQPHLYADLIDVWRLSGCQVWYRALECKDFKGQCLNDEFNLYPFARPDKYEYSLTPFED